MQCAGYLETMVEQMPDGTGFMCLVCRKVVLKKGNLKKHILSMHTGEQSQDCPACGKQFKNANSLQNHISLQHRGFDKDPLFTLNTK